MYTVKDMPRPLSAELVSLMQSVETATVGHWHLYGFMDPGMRPLLGSKRVVGTAVTLAIPGADSTLLHHAAGLLRQGDVLVVDRLGDQRHACWGGGVTVAAKAAGAVAGIVDGPCTDLSEIQQSDFPMWCRGLSAMTTRLYNLGGGLNIPISCGGVPVLPGDLVLADESGVLVLRREEAFSIAQEALRRQGLAVTREEAVRNGAKLGDLTGASAKVKSAPS